MANYLVAVSGGVDSVVLLDMLSKSTHRLIVAHVDHGIRSDSEADARFVEALAKNYKLPFVTKRFELGASASEEQARAARYEFLFEQAKQFNATIVTAHHQGDLVETIAINVQRGTGWRGLTVLNRKGINRPLTALTKQQLYDYALRNHLEWVEDGTNATDAYQRNRLRRLLGSRLNQQNRERLSTLRAKQIQLRRDIEHESLRIIKSHAASRHFLTQIDHNVAVELLGTIIDQQTSIRPTRPQLERALIAIKTAKAGTIHHVGDRIELHFTPRAFAVKVV